MITRTRRWGSAGVAEGGSGGAVANASAIHASPTRGRCPPPTLPTRRSAVYELGDALLAVRIAEETLRSRSARALLGKRTADREDVIAGGRDGSRGRTQDARRSGAASGGRAPPPSLRGDRRRRTLRPRDGHAAAPVGRRDVHHRGAVRRCRRHLAGQHLPGVQLRRAVAPLLVLLRAEDRLESPVRRAARDPGVCATVCRGVRARLSFASRHDGDRGAVRRRPG